MATGEAAGDATMKAQKTAAAGLACLLVLRLAFWVFAPPNSDEAYYWLWGLKPALCYFDHPPLHAWMEGLVHAILGQSRFALRLPTAFTTVGSIALVARMARQSKGTPRSPLLVTAAVVLASPLFLMLMSFAWQDHLLVFFVLLSASLFLDVLSEVAAGGRGSTKKLLAAGLALGLAALSKYTAVFLAVGLAATVIADGRLRPLLRQPRLYAAALACLAVMTPILIWNLDNGFLSFRFHSTEHLQGGLELHPSGFVHFLFPTLVFVSPVLGTAMLASLRPPRKAALAPYASVLWRLGLATFVASTTVFVAVSFVVWSLYYWNVVAYLLLLPPAVEWMSTHQRSLRWHVWLGVGVAVVMVVHGAVVPFSALVPNSRDDDSFEVYGWQDVVAAVRAEQRPGEKIVADDYRPASHLDWTLGGLGAAVICLRPSQFDLWQEPRLEMGDSAIVITDQRGPLTPELVSQFQRVTPLRKVRISRLGFFLKDYDLWRAEGYQGAHAPSPGSG